MKDAGADAVFDFVDVGLPSSILDADEFRERLQDLLGLIAEAKPDVVVAEQQQDATLGVRAEQMAVADGVARAWSRMRMDASRVNTVSSRDSGSDRAAARWRASGSSAAPVISCAGQAAQANVSKAIASARRMRLRRHPPCKLESERITPISLLALLAQWQVILRE